MPTINPGLIDELHNIPAASHGNHNARIEAVWKSYKLYMPQRARYKSCLDFTSEEI